MADLNVTYYPYTHKYDIQAFKIEVAYDFLPPNVQANVDTFLKQIEEFNNSQASFASAVKVPYRGSTTQERQEWLATRIEAVYARLDQIRADVEGNKQQLINLGIEPPVDVFATAAQLLSIIPVTRPVGAFAQVVAKLINNDSANAAYKQSKLRQSNEILSGYVTDLQQLNNIQKQLLAEYTSGPKANGDGSGGTTDPIFGAAKAIPTYYYYIGGFIILIILLMIAKNRRQTGR